MVHRVASRAPGVVPVTAVSRAAYDAAGVDTGGGPAGPARATGQHRTGGRVGGAGRASNTHRDTWRTLGPGMRRAISGALINRGIEAVLLSLLGERPPAEVYERIKDGLSSKCREYYRGEVWPLRGIFGVLSRFPAGVIDGGGCTLTPIVVTKWLTDNGTVSRSCLRRVAQVTRHGQPPSEGTCEYAHTFRGAIEFVSARLGVSPETFRRRHRV